MARILFIHSFDLDFVLYDHIYVFKSNLNSIFGYTAQNFLVCRIPILVKKA
ncbi:hypothetical protein C2G38_2083047 [Gigaspora rosea]|uniref:Uncharacterized protein n=1 Tax=Gigaspora rosea TaxID=44941 RepID=A0A397VJV4_9GLOM|nr:hypothetical protein C2G38_2083047 [Gigaspora rosea]